MAAEGELGGIADRVRALERAADEAHVGFNNERGDFALRGAASLKQVMEKR